MIVQTEFLKKIKDFGLNTYEAKVWTALLSRGVSTAGELSDIANVPRSRSYDILESLEKKGFVVMKLGKPIKYIAVPPEEALDRVKKSIKKESETQIKSLEDIKNSELINELNLLHSEGVSLVDPTDITASMKGREKLHTHMESMIKEAQKSVVLLTTEDGVLRKLSSLSKVLKKANDRGVKISIAAPRTEKNNEILKEAEGYAEVTHTDIKGRFCIVDDKHVLFMLLDDDKVHPAYDTGVWANSEFFSRTLKNMYTSSVQ